MDRAEFEEMTGIVLAEISASRNEDKPYNQAKANAEKGKASAALICCVNRQYGLEYGISGR